MYNILENKSDVYAFEIIENNIVFLTNCSLYEKGIYINTFCIYESNVCCFVRLLEKKVIFGTWDYKIFIYQNNSLDLLIEGYSLDEQKYNDQTIIITKKESKGIYSTFLFDIETKRIKSEVKERIAVSSNTQKIFWKAKNELKSLSLKTGEYTWETNLAKELTIADESQFRIVQLVGILGNNLWVTYSIDRFEGLLAVDCATGYVSWKVSSRRTTCFLGSVDPYSCGERVRAVSCG